MLEFKDEVNEKVLKITNILKTTEVELDKTLVSRDDRKKLKEQFAEIYNFLTSIANGFPVSVEKIDLDNYVLLLCSDQHMSLDQAEKLRKIWRGAIKNKSEVIILDGGIKPLFIKRQKVDRDSFS